MSPVLVESDGTAKGVLIRLSYEIAERAVCKPQTTPQYCSIFGGDKRTCSYDQDIAGGGIWINFSFNPPRQVRIM